MKRIRRRLRKTRTKLARVLRLLEASHHETHRQWAKARSARKNAVQARRQGKQVTARKAEARANFHQEKAQRWERRTDWLAGKRKHLTKAEREWLAKKEKWLKDHPPPSTGWSEWSGRDVPAWMVPWLKKSVAEGWKGFVVSGIRTEQHSISLCYGICNHSSCPGLCAGAGSNHNCTAGCPYPTGALDVTDYLNFQSIQYRIGSPLRNHLPSDRVHFSVSGY